MQYWLPQCLTCESRHVECIGIMNKGQVFSQSEISHRLISTLDRWHDVFGIVLILISTFRQRVRYASPLQSRCRYYEELVHTPAITRTLTQGVNINLFTSWWEAVPPEVTPVTAGNSANRFCERWAHPCCLLPHHQRKLVSLSFIYKKCHVRHWKGFSEQSVGFFILFIHIIQKPFFFLMLSSSGLLTCF